VYEEALDVVVAALGRSLGSKRIQKRGLEALSHFFFCSTHDAAREKEVAPLVVAAMARYPLVEELHEHGLCILGELSTPGSETVGAVVAALERALDSETIQLLGIEALGSFCDTSSHATLMREQGAAPLVVAALARYPAMEVLQGRGLYVLGRLFTNSSVVCEEALDAVVTALERSPGSEIFSEIIHEEGLEALYSLCDDHPQHTELAREKGVVTQVITTLARYPAVKTLQQHGRNVLGCLLSKVGGTKRTRSTSPFLCVVTSY
jgi:hypothetical protein